MPSIERSIPHPASLLVTFVLAACGNRASPADESTAAAGSGGAGTTAQTADANASSTSASGSGGTSGARAAAATATATTNDACTAVAPFYWEIGDAGGAIVSGSTGDGSFTASTSMKIASASKLIFGAYVVERFRDDPQQIDVEAMTMQSGYVSFEDCGVTKTVAGCLALGENGNLDPAEVGHFDYGAGHYRTRCSLRIRPPGLLDVTRRESRRCAEGRRSPIRPRCEGASRGSPGPPYWRDRSASRR